MNTLVQNPIMDPASFRDPSGFIFSRNGTLYRQVNPAYREQFDLFKKSGLSRSLIENHLLVPHEEADPSMAATSDAYCVLQPERVPFISYPYEWCFSQLKDAALLTLEIQKQALEAGMSLKDASAYNIQFKSGKPIFIDTLSFEKYEEGKPWVAYRQFCQHFLAPLALMAYTDIRLNQLLRIYIDGIPLDLASRLLPAKTRYNLSLLSHIHLHAKSQTHFADKGTSMGKPGGGNVNRMALLGIIDSLSSTIKGIRWLASGTEWGDYYDKTNYSQRSFEHKKELIARFLTDKKPSTIWDIGGNTGVFSRVAAAQADLVISYDIDSAAVEHNYHLVRKNREKNLLPLVLDLTNPSPGIGWHNQERFSFMERGPADAILALALIHHLAISNNLPFARIAQLLADISPTLIIEFVPKDDSYVQRLLASREDIFPHYTREKFEEEFSRHFTIAASEPILESQRILYLMNRR